MATTDSQIISMISEGGPRAEEGFRVLYAQYAQLIMYRLRTFGVRAEDLDDIFQETCLKIIKAAKTYNGGSMTAWLTTIAKNTAQDLIFRKHKAVSETIEFVETDFQNPSNTENDFIDCELQNCMKNAIRDFKINEPSRCFALELQKDGASIEEISILIERTTSATKEFISQSKKKLKPYLQTCFEMITQ